MSQLKLHYNMKQFLMSEASLEHNILSMGSVLQKKKKKKEIIISMLLAVQHMELGFRQLFIMKCICRCFNGYRAPKSETES